MMPNMVGLSSDAAATAKSSLFSVENQANCAILRLNNPPVNRLDTPLIRSLTAQLEKIEDDASLNSVIFTSSVANVFTAGVDILEMVKTDRERLRNFWQALQAFWIKLYGSNKIYIAAINGHALAFGCVLAMSCDYRIMVDADRYKIGLNAALLGIKAPFWFRDTMINTIGYRETERSLQTGRVFTPKAAFDIGLVDELVSSPEELMTRANERVQAWTRIPDVARAMTKRMMREDTLNRLLSQKDADIENFIESTLDPVLQANLEKYLESLKKK